MHKFHGFSLLEMLVALALLSAVGGALYSLLSNQFGQLRHFQSVQRQLNQQQLLMQWVAGLNPMQQAQGEAAIGSQRAIHWQAIALAKPHSSSVKSLDITDDDNMSEFYHTQLYTVHLELWESGQRLSQVDVVQVGTEPIYKAQPLQVK